MNQSASVKIVECPRDAWQGLPGQIPSETKAAYLQQLMDAGFRHIDAASFVSARAVPQMADSEAVLALINPSPDVDIIGIVVNVQGAERAIKTGSVTTLGFPFSISPTFLKRNQNQSPEESLATLTAIGKLAMQGGLGIVAYISMAFGNPYGDPWSVDLAAEACDQIAAAGVKQISLADTVGLADPNCVSHVFKAVLRRHDELEVGVHLHARPGDATAKIQSAYRAGCRGFDAALGGLGGCPFAQDALVGNVATEELLVSLRSLGASLPDLRLDGSLLRANREIAGEFGHVADGLPAGK